ncbi:MAG: sodium:proton antiporter [Muribaculaceae bacterium]|nr:sodium:proton antiporter [Muribaculaceae bacterium]
MKKLPLWAAVAPIVILLASLVSIIVFEGAQAINEYSQIALLGSAAIAVVLARMTGALSRRGLKTGFARSAGQILPAVPMLVCIAMVATTWMMSGVVPTLIDLGFKWMNPTFFLVSSCAISAIISVLTGSSWSTIATIGVALMGVGTVMGFSPGWIAGAIISGAYFGDKVSPLSDTTVVASSTCGVDLFRHIKYLMLTAVPAMGIALLVYLAVGLVKGAPSAEFSRELIHDLHAHFNITRWTLVIPALTLVLIACKVRTILTLALAAALGFAGIFIFQPQNTDGFWSAFTALWSGNSMQTSNALLNDLAGTGGISGMMSTITLVLSAMVFGSVMIGTGMLGVITAAFASRLKKRTSIVGATVAGGLFMNSCTADQYLSIIITGNMFRNVYRRFRLEPRLLSRTLEDAVSVTSVLIPWNSCGITQSTVLGVSTLVYLPFCIFNILSPFMSVFMAWIGFRIPQYAPVRVRA